MGKNLANLLIQHALNKDQATILLSNNIAFQNLGNKKPN